MVETLIRDDVNSSVKTRKTTSDGIGRKRLKRVGTTDRSTIKAKEDIRYRTLERFTLISLKRDW